MATTEPSCIPNQLGPVPHVCQDILPALLLQDILRRQATHGFQICPRHRNRLRSSCRTDMPTHLPTFCLQLGRVNPRRKVWKPTSIIHGYRHFLYSNRYYGSHDSYSIFMEIADAQIKKDIPVGNFFFRFFVRHRKNTMFKLTTADTLYTAAALSV